MGRCHEFGSQIREGCAHPMRAGQHSCSCPECGVVCEGQFDGCPDVWARGPRLVPAAEPFESEQVVSLGRVRSVHRGKQDDLPLATSPPASKSPFAPSNGNLPDFSRENPAIDEPRSEILRWFEDAFDGVRTELRAIATSVTEQHAAITELMDSRQADLRLVAIAESLPAIVDDAVRKAMSDHSVAMVDFIDSSLGDFRALLKKSQAAAREATEAARQEQAAGVDAMKATIAKQLKPMTAAIKEAVELQAEAKEEDAARLPALKAAVTKQLRPVESAMVEAVERSDRRLRDISERLKQLEAATLGTRARAKSENGRTPRRRP